MVVLKISDASMIATDSGFMEKRGLIVSVLLTRAAMPGWRQRAGACRGAAAMPFVLNLPSLGFAGSAARKKRLVVMFSPNGIVPNDFWPDEEGESFTLKESLKPLEPFRESLARGLELGLQGRPPHRWRWQGRAVHLAVRRQR